MARRSRMSVQKRQRERKKAEKAAMKREERATRGEEEDTGGGTVATRDDLAGYGLVDEAEEQAEAEVEEEPS